MRRKLVAVCSPFPPEKSGIADYNKRLLGELCRRHPVETHIVVGGDPATYEPSDVPQMTLVSVRQFRWLAEHGYYDSIIHCMGNSPFHGYIYDLMKEHPGTVWLHDIRLTDFYRWYYQRHLGRDISKLPEELEDWADRYPDHKGDLLLRDNVIQHQQGIYLAGEVASLAEGLIVGSGYSKELIQIEGKTEVPVAVIPLAAAARNGRPTQEDWESLARRYRLSGDKIPIVSVGIVAPTKCPEAIIDAFASVASEDNDLVLVFVGPSDDPYMRELERRATNLAIGERVLFPGYVDEDEFDAWLAACRCAVQLRFPSNGESSAAILHCLAAGIPTIVSDHGPLRELPDEAAIKVPAQVEPAELANAMQKIVSNQALRLRLRDGALRYAKTVSMEAVADRLWTEVLCAP